MMARKRKNELAAPIVIDDGCLPDNPILQAQLKTSCLKTASGVLPSPPKKS
jgi:hypothetical protein